MNNMPKYLQLTITDENNEPLGVVTANRKEFSTGSIGYNAGGKIVVNGTKLQVSCNLVVVHSKTMPESEKQGWV